MRRNGRSRYGSALNKTTTNLSIPLAMSVYHNEFLKNALRNHFETTKVFTETSILVGCCEIVHSNMKFKDDF
jgi:hypothetical protein